MRLRNRELPSPVDPIMLGGDLCFDVFARNPQGLHVPLSTMSDAQRRDAVLWRYLCEPVEEAA